MALVPGLSRLYNFVFELASHTLIIPEIIIMLDLEMRWGSSGIVLHVVGRDFMFLGCAHLLVLVLHILVAEQDFILNPILILFLYIGLGRVQPSLEFRSLGSKSRFLRHRDEPDISDLLLVNMNHPT